MIFHCLRNDVAHLRNEALTCHQIGGNINVDVNAMKYSCVGSIVVSVMKYVKLLCKKSVFVHFLGISHLRMDMSFLPLEILVQMRNCLVSYVLRIGIVHVSYPYFGKTILTCLASYSYMEDSSLIVIILYDFERGLVMFVTCWDHDNSSFEIK